MYDYTYYDYGNSYDYGYEATSAFAGLAAFGIIIWLIAMAVSVITIISMWKLFTKAGKPGWAAIIPIYNIIVMLEIAELPMWYIALYFVPGANIYAMIKTYIEVAHKFGKSTGFGVGIAFLSPIFLPMLAFSKNANYVGAQNVAPTYQQPVQPTPSPVQQPVVEPVAPTYQQPVQPTPSPVQQPVVEPVTPTPEIQPVPEVTPVEVAPVQEPVVPVVEQEVTPQPIPVTVETPNPSTTPAFCTNCGSALMPNAKFCTSCGKQI